MGKVIWFALFTWSQPTLAQLQRGTCGSEEESIHPNPPFTSQTLSLHLKFLFQRPMLFKTEQHLLIPGVNRGCEERRRCGLGADGFTDAGFYRYWVMTHAAV